MKPVTSPRRGPPPIATSEAKRIGKTWRSRRFTETSIKIAEFGGLGLDDSPPEQHLALVSDDDGLHRVQPVVGRNARSEIAGHLGSVRKLKLCTNDEHPRYASSSPEIISRTHSCLVLPLNVFLTRNRASQRVVRLTVTKCARRSPCIELFSEPQSDRGGRLGRRDDGDHLDLEEILPPRHPLREEGKVVAFHDLEAAAEVLCDPARDVWEALWCQPAPVAEPPVPGTARRRESSR